MQDTIDTAGLNDRQLEIQKLVHREGFVSIEGLADYFNVTTQTIRRDINSLCSEGLLRRYHGGAGLPSSVENVEYSDRKTSHSSAKRRIARLVAKSIPNDASLFINIGTTNEEIARALMNHKGLRVITNNLNVAYMLSSNPEIEVTVAGGVVRSRDLGITGEATIDLIRQFKVDYGIIGISGIDTDGSLLEFDYREVRVAQAIIGNSREVFLAVDSTKFGRKAMVRLGHIKHIHALFTDTAPPENISHILEEEGAALHIASS